MRSYEPIESVSQDDIVITFEVLPCPSCVFLWLFMAGEAVLNSSPVFKDLFLAGWWRTVLQFHLALRGQCLMGLGMLKFLKACHVRAKKETAVQRGHVQMHENLAMSKQDRVTPSLSLSIYLSLCICTGKYGIFVDVFVCVCTFKGKHSIMCITS